MKDPAKYLMKESIQDAIELAYHFQDKEKVTIQQENVMSTAHLMYQYRTARWQVKEQQGNIPQQSEMGVQ